MPRLKLLPLAAMGLFLALPATAGQSDDMFYNWNTVTSDRLYVHSDRSRHSDFFPTYQPYLRPDKDMFDHIHSDPGVTDMFPTRKRAAPDEKLYQWPSGSARQ